MTSHQILSLLQKREELLKNLSEVNAQIIRFTLDHGTDSAIFVPAARASGRHDGSGAKSGSRRKWFERGEMVKLAKKLLAQPMSQADLVRGLAGAKGYDKGLPASERARFKSAAYQAIAAALNGKQLFRNKAGQVSARR
ncbi:MAG TPA: hypothetical protein VED83_05465 [Burkholderiaceae bacterium]|nr:hypothetical protein [Burkholderiaceae bacterium]HYB49669.1 hypothetical protein [Burkholderiaceae bacterium]